MVQKTMILVAAKHKEWVEIVLSFGCNKEIAEDIVQEVSAGADTGVSVNGIVTSVLRYQGVIVPQRTEVRLFYVHVCLCCLYSEHLIASTSIKRGENCRRLTTVLIDSSIR